MAPPILEDQTLPGLYQSANSASIISQSIYFLGLRFYLVLLVVAALVSFLWPLDWRGAIASAILFLITLGILIALRVKRPDDLWYNGRAVAESVKTRSWRWAMRSEPYEDATNLDLVSRLFISDLKVILGLNRSLSCVLGQSEIINDPISKEMLAIRRLSVSQRLDIYRDQRINEQAMWYSKKSLYNKRKASQWFWCSVVLHSLAIMMLLYRIKNPNLNIPVGVVATAAGAVFTWLQANKYNELNSSYALAAHEIVLIKGNSLSVKSEKELSDFVLSSEVAFSREHTQWIARKDT